MINFGQIENQESLPLDSISLFLKDWLSNKILAPTENKNLVQRYGNLTSTRLYRSGKFQVELLSVLPNTEIPDHMHPNMDSYEVYIGGDITFRAGALELTPTSTGQYLRIRPNCPHGGTFGTSGGVFLSVQEWNISPLSAGQDWAFIDKTNVEKTFPLKGGI